jgi:hypothetical protein
MLQSIDSKAFDRAGGCGHVSAAFVSGEFSSSEGSGGIQNFGLEL